jgi:hypothetical protein
MMKKEYVMPTVVVLSVQLGKMLIPSLNVDDDEIVDDQGAKSYDILTDDDDELVVPIKDKWEDLSEKKNGK